MQYDKFSEFRSELESIFRQNALKSLRKNYKIKNLFDGIVRISLDFKVSGSYREIKRFIFNIEKNNKMVFFKELALSKTKSGILGNFSLEAYFVR
jgi:Tfp pilus assembly protein PilO